MAFSFGKGKGMTLTVHDVAEILEHWEAGTSIKAIARILRRNRHTIRKYVIAAQAQGYQPSPGNGPAKGWRAWAAETFPELPPYMLTGSKELDWEEYVAVAEGFKYKADPQDWEDLRQDIIVRAAEVARIYEIKNKPFTRGTMVWVARFTVRRYWYDLSRRRRVVSLSTTIAGEDKRRPTELSERLADDRAIDLDAWIDAKARLRECPQRVVEIACKRVNGMPSDRRDSDHLKYYRNKVKQQLVASK